MTEEIPPSSLTVGPAPAQRPVESGSAWTLRTSRERWYAIGSVSWLRAFAVVAGGWGLMAWNRFGFQGLSAPRAGVRFVLVGIYAWIGMALLLWCGDLLAVHFASKRLVQDRRPRFTNPRHLIQIIGLAHQPMVVVGILLLIGQAIPFPGVMTAGVAVAFLAWIPAVVVAALGSVVGRSWAYAAILTAVAYGAWLATAGRFLLSRLEHLI